MCCQNALAVPAKPGLMKYTQPDGSVVELRLCGDENFHYYVSADGQKLLMQKDGRFVNARLASDGRLVESAVAVSPATLRDFKPQKVRGVSHKVKPAATAGQLKSFSGLFPDASFPAKGTQKVLVIIVQYKDVKFNIDNPLDYFNRMLNEEGFSDYLGTGSCRDYFIASSNGLFTPEFDVYGPITLANNMSYYGGNDWYGNDSNPQKMVVEACQQLNDDVDFSQYDRDGDGYIDNVYVFYAGRGEASGGSADSVWPHSWYVTEGEYQSYIFDGVQLDRYACSNEWDMSSEGLGYRPAGVGTFCHEFSHVMGLPDLYATSYTSSFTPGEWSVMDYGPYNHDGCTPPLYSAFERAALGYINPTEITGKANITLRTIDTGDACVIKTTKANEYFLFENRQQQGWDTYIPGHGMLVWHIDYNGSVWEQNTVNNTSSHQYVDLIEADGTQSEYSRDGDSFPGASNINSYTYAGTPSFRPWNGTNLGLDITDITETDGKIMFRVNGGFSAATAPVALEATDVKAGSFVANWDAQDNVQSYTLILYGKLGRPGSEGAEEFSELRRFNAGLETSFQVTNLTPETEYRYTVKAEDGFQGSPESNVISVTTTAPTFDYFAPVATEAEAVTAESFTATWEAMEGATEYFLDVNTVVEGESVEETIDFTDGMENLPKGWSSSSQGTYGMSSYAGNAVPSLRMAADNDILTSPKQPNGINNVKFWHRGNATTADEKIVLSGNIDGAWQELATFDIITDKGGSTIDYAIEQKGVTQVRLTFKRPTKGAVAIDDVCISVRGDEVETPLLPTVSAGSVISYLVDGLAPETLYSYSLTATDGNYTSLRSNVIKVVTDKKESAAGEVVADRLVFALAGRKVVADRNITVYDITGRRIAGNARTAELPMAGMYIITAEGAKAVKIVVK